MIIEHAGLIEILLGTQEANPLTKRCEHKESEGPKVEAQSRKVRDRPSRIHNKRDKEFSDNQEEERPKDFVESVRSHSEQDEVSKEIDKGEERDLPEERERPKRREVLKECKAPKEPSRREVHSRSRKSERRSNNRSKKSKGKSDRSLARTSTAGGTLGETVVSGMYHVIANPHSKKSALPDPIDDSSLIKPTGAKRESKTRYRDEDGTASYSTESSDSYDDDDDDLVVDEDDDDDWVLANSGTDDGTWIFKPAPSEKYSCLCCLPGEIY
jgi:hypothetical protein